MLRVIAEDDPSHISLVPDGIYGPETMASVSRFQSLHDLPVTGITDLGTWEEIVAVYEPAYIRMVEAQPLEVVLNPGQTIRRGEHSPNLYLVQSILMVLGETYTSVPSPEVNGVLDEATADSLATFQALSGLPVTGNLDKQTWKHLSMQYPLASNFHGKYR